MNAPQPTDRLIFRLFTEDDVDNLFRLLSDPDVMRFSLHGPMTIDKMPVWLGRRICDYQAGRPAQYAVLDRANGKFLGFCGYIPFDDLEGEADYEIGYRFLPTCWNQGIATEATRQTLAFGFANFALNTVVAVVERENIASVRVLEKSGMSYVKDTLYHDIPVMRYVIRREETDRWEIDI